jgi:hypothetical protein
MSAVSPDHAKLIRQLETIASLSEADCLSLAALPFGLKSISENRDIVREGDRPNESCLILEGLACRYKMVAGGRRQILFSLFRRHARPSKPLPWTRWTTASQSWRRRGSHLLLTTPSTA